MSMQQLSWVKKDLMLFVFLTTRVRSARRAAQGLEESQTACQSDIFHPKITSCRDLKRPDKEVPSETGTGELCGAQRQ